VSSLIVKVKGVRVSTCVCARVCVCVCVCVLGHDVLHLKRMGVLGRKQSQSNHSEFINNEDILNYSIKTFDPF
jgi:hypothetical protein